MKDPHIQQGDALKIAWFVQSNLGINVKCLNCEHAAHLTVELLRTLNPESQLWWLRKTRLRCSICGRGGKVSLVPARPNENRASPVREIVTREIAPRVPDEPSRPSRSWAVTPPTENFAHAERMELERLGTPPQWEEWRSRAEIEGHRNSKKGRTKRRFRARR